MKEKIFNSLKINKIKLKNRFVVSPMCQYSSKNGNPIKWHYKHLENLASSGAALLMLEATAVEKKGKITHSDMSLANNENFKNLNKLINFLKKDSDIKLGLQISHAGRKGSAELPWIKPNSSLKKNSWKTISSSKIKKELNWPYPKQMNNDDINYVRKAFDKSSKYASRMNLDCLELHMAHGYLLHQFFSPISNKRTDEYGGNLNNRCRFLIEIAKIVRKNWSKHKILGARITGKDWIKGGIDTKDSIYLSKQLKSIGFDYVCVSSGGLISKTDFKPKENFNYSIAKKIKKESKILVRVGGSINDINFMKKIINRNDVDLISNARKYIYEPNFILKELSKLNPKNKVVPNQYRRCYKI
jgi:2,4-dienoyl-CoA reductase-like NADH-dependent reductase (Old Yellow Enzyme family)